jgi:hypothetical protein
MVPPLPKDAPAADQELVRSIFRRNNLIISGKIPASDYSDISSMGRRSGGAKPRERHVTLILYDSFPMIQEKQDGFAAPEGLPAGGSRTWLCNSPRKSPYPIIRAYSLRGTAASITSRK